MPANVMRIAVVAALAGTGVLLGACAAEKPATAANWSFPGEQPATAPRPLMRLATLPMNPAPPAPYDDYTDEPTRFLFHAHIVVIDQETGQPEDTGGDASAAEDTGGEE